MPLAASRRAALTLILTLLRSHSLALAETGEPTVEQFAPRGTVRNVRQVTARFSHPMVPVGDPRAAAAPFDIDCTEAGAGRWVDSRNWAYDFARDLPAGVQCTFRLHTGLKTLAGAALVGESRFTFSTGGPSIRSSIPVEGDESIAEDQAFVLTLDADVSEESVLDHVWFRVEGIPEQVGVEIVTGESRDTILQSLAWRDLTGPVLVLQAQRRFPSGTKITLVWGKGVATASGIASEEDQSLAFVTRVPFTAQIYCERTNAEADCLPITSINLGFSAPVAWDLAQRIALVGPDGKRWSPDTPEPAEQFVSRAQFKGPFPESAMLQVEVPKDLHDDSGRSLSNASEFPLPVKTDPYPPLAKFPARFGIIESGDPVLPVTLRNLEAEVQAQRERLTDERPSGYRATLRALMDRLSGSVRRIPPDRLNEILPWLQKVASAKRTESVFGPTKDAAAQSFKVPKPNGAKAFEVVGIPLQSPGLYIVELQSPRLGASLLGRPESMYVPTAALVTNLAVHFKWGRENSLVWVTTLDGAQPVEGAQVSLLDCSSTVLWTGTTDAQGLARVDTPLAREMLPVCPRSSRFGKEAEEDDTEYYYDDSSQSQALDSLNQGILVVAQTPLDISFVHSSWNRGVEPWRYQLPSEDWRGPITVHTIFDRMLFRAGETVHMKHILRRETMSGFELVPTIEQFTGLSIRHEGSNERYDLSLDWDAQGAAENAWEIPKSAKLGRYLVVFTRAAGQPGSLEYVAGRFRVEEFRVPLMRGIVKLPAEPQVNVSSVPVDLSLQYLAGGGAGGLPVLLRSQLRPRPFRPPQELERFTFANGPVQVGVSHRGVAETQPAADGAVRPGPIRRQDVVLDATGSARVTIDNLPPADTVRELLAEMEFRDPSGEVQTVAATMPLWPAQWVVGIDAEYSMRSKENVHAKIAVVDVGGHAVSGARVRVEMLPRKTYSHRKRLVGGFYAYDHFEETSPSVGVLCEGPTNTQGILFCDGHAPVDGDIVLQAMVTDVEGRTSAAHKEVWVAGHEDWWFDVEDSDRIDLLPEMPQYEPGETARFQVRMPFREATALVTVEREGVREARVIALSGREPVIEVPVLGTYAPNIFVSVLAVRGRVGGVQPTAMVDLGKPAWKLGIAEIRVGWAAHTLAVTVTSDRQVYQVREEAEARIAVRTAQGEAPPSGSEVALAAVDEGLLELQPNSSWDLLAAMMGRRGYAIQTASAQTQVVGKRHYGLKTLPQGGGGGRQTTRELFDTLLLWQARVPLDPEGNAVVKVPLNDSLTSFRIVAVATGGVASFGTGSTSIRSTQDLMLLSGLPPVVREGDRYRAEFTLRNTSDRAMDVRVSAGVEGLNQPLQPQVRSLGPGEAAVMGWDVTVPASIASLVYTVDASEDGGAGDRLRITQPVHPAVPVRTLQATLQHLEQSLQQPVQRPVDALPERGGLQVNAAPTLGGGLDGVREWMRSYPYTCLEQRVSRAVALHDAALWTEVVAALPSYLDSDGLLKYFPTLTSGSEVLTAYVLALTTQAGLALPADVQGQMEAGLAAFVQGALQRKSPLPAVDLSIRKLAALAALAGVGKADAAWLGSITIEPNLWPTSAVLDWWSILQQVAALADREPDRRTAERIIRTRLNLQGTTMGFSTREQDNLWWLMVCPDSDAVRLPLWLLQTDQWQQDLPQLMRGALARQRKGHWDCTTTNAWGTLTVDKFSHVFEATPVHGTLSATLGAQSEHAEWSDPARDIRFSFPWPEAPATLQVAHTGSGTPWVTIASRAAVPLTEPISTGYRITKSVTPVTPRDPTRLSRGDVVRVRLEIDAQSDMTWVVVNDPIPTGASHLGTGLARDSQIQEPDDTSPTLLFPAFVERPFDALRAYYDFVPKGMFVVEYTIRLNQSGRFALPPTRVEALYAPEMFGEVPNAVVEVQP